MKSYANPLSLICAGLMMTSTAMDAQVVHFVFSPDLAASAAHTVITIDPATGEEVVFTGARGQFSLSRQEVNNSWDGTGTMSFSAGGAFVGYGYITESSASISQIKPLGEGEMIDGDSFGYTSTAIGSGYDVATWAVGTTAYVGFHFEIDLATHYGWLELTRSEDAISISQLAYQATAMTGIQAGQISAVPEPSTCAVLAGITALGLVVWRRRRA